MSSGSREIRIAARLVHPHILSIHDSGDVAGTFYYVMPYVAESLRNRLSREGRFDVEEAVRIATQLADALDYAHGRGVLHRDIKPENILIEESQAALAELRYRSLRSRRRMAIPDRDRMRLGNPGLHEPGAVSGEEVDERAHNEPHPCFELSVPHDVVWDRNAERTAFALQAHGKAPDESRAFRSVTRDQIMTGRCRGHVIAAVRDESDLSDLIGSG